MREAACHVDVGLIGIGALSSNVIYAILRRLLTELHVCDLMRSDLVSRKLDEIFEKSLVILALVADSTILLRLTFCAIYLRVVRVVHILELDIGGQAALLGRVLVNWLLTGVQRRCISLLRRLR